MPMTCFCQETAVASHDIALYTFKKSAHSDTMCRWHRQPKSPVAGVSLVVDGNSPHTTKRPVRRS
jgi:hypothetical protein